MGALVRDRRAQVFFLVSLLFAGWWVYLQLFVNKSNILLQYFGASYGIVALIGAIFGLFISRHWGGFRSVLGKAIIMFSLGLFAQEFGQIAYSVYTYFLKVGVPYPSWGDLGFFGSIPLYAMGVYFLAKASGVKFGLKSVTSKIQAVILPAVILILGYTLFLRDYQFDWSNPLKIFLDFGYPLGQAVYVSMAILTYLLSRGILGGIMRSKILFIIFALCFQFLSDYNFLYQNINGKPYPGGVVDFIYLVSYFLMGIGLIQFGIVLGKIRKDTT